MWFNIVFYDLFTLFLNHFSRLYFDYWFIFVLAVRESGNQEKRLVHRNIVAALSFNLKNLIQVNNLYRKVIVLNSTWFVTFLI